MGTKRKHALHTLAARADGGSAMESGPAALLRELAAMASGTGRRSEGDAAAVEEAQPFESNLADIAWPPTTNGQELRSEVLSLVAALLEEHGTSVSNRLVAEVAAGAYADWLLANRVARGLDELDQSAECRREVDKLRREADRCARRMLAALELLRRPAPQNIKLTVSNLNCGQQVLQQTDDPQALESTRPRKTRRHPQ